MKINITQIITDAGTQMRESLDMGAVEDYRNATDLPPVIVFHDKEAGERYLADGFHRLKANELNGCKMISCKVIEGTLRDAILFAAAANADHGLRRSVADKRKSVQTLLDDPEWSEWSDRKIAEQCAVSHTFVAKMRAHESDNVATQDESQSGNIATSEATAVRKTATTKTSHKPESVAKLPPETKSETVEVTETTTTKVTGGTAFNVDEYEEEESEVFEDSEDSDSDDGDHDWENYKEEAEHRGKLIRREYSDLVKRFRDLGFMLKEYCETEYGEPLLKNEQSFKTHIDAIVGYIKTEMPHCVCYVCEGEGCDSCENYGTMTQRRHDSRIPDDESVVVYLCPRTPKTIQSMKK